MPVTSEVYINIQISQHGINQNTTIRQSIRKQAIISSLFPFSSRKSSMFLWPQWSDCTDENCQQRRKKSRSHVFAFSMTNQIRYMNLPPANYTAYINSIDDCGEQFVNYMMINGNREISIRTLARDMKQCVQFYMASWLKV